MEKSIEKRKNMQEKENENNSDVEIENKKDNLQEKWDNVVNKIEMTADAEGYEIDKGIKEVVIALNALEINTGQSCEGHADSGFSSPWVRIEAPNEPEERFINQNIVFEKVSKKYGMPTEETRRMYNMNAYWEAMHECSKNGETEEFKKWKKESEKLLYVIKEILNDFYESREVSDELKIKTDSETIDDMAEGSFEIFNGGNDHRIVSDEIFSQEEKDALGSRIEKYRSEMKAFSEFLKSKFFSEGEDYIDKKRKKIQEKIDAIRLDEIRNDVLL